MTLDDFITKYTNVPVDVDHAYGNQCMDLMHEYVYDVLGITDLKILAAPDAKSVYLNFDTVPGHDLFEKIDNTPDGVPQKGDIIFFGDKVGKYGHVCIFITGNTKNFTSFDQNWPTGSLPSIVTHTYTGCLGWLRCKEPAKPTVEVFTDKFNELVTKSTTVDELCTLLDIQFSHDIFISKIKADLEYKKQLEDMNQQKDRKISELTSQVAEMQKTLDEVTKEKDAIVAQYSDLQNKLTDSQAAVTVLTSTINDLKAQLTTIQAQISKPTVKGITKVIEGLYELFGRK